MKLKSVQVQNYKCIENSGKFGVDQITCLVGKNEAGKSALLEALYKLNPVDPDEARFEETEYPRRHVSTYRERQDRAPANVLTTTWELEKDDLDAVAASLDADIFSNNRVTFSKGYDNTRRCVVNIDENKLVTSLFESSEIDDGERSSLGRCGTVESLIEELARVETPSEGQKKLLGHLGKLFPTRSATDAIGTILEKQLPHFIYFAEYDKLLGRVSIDDFLKRREANNLEFGHRIFAALLDLVNTTPEGINDIGKSEQLFMELEAVSNRLTDEIFSYWSQNRHLAVKFHFDHARPQDPAPFNSGYVFSTRIYNARHRATVSFDERSTGFVWFFSFLIWFSNVKKNYGDNIFLLLDEPGLSLHGRAQRDLVRYFNEKLRPDHQTIYTAHSPFMIDVENIFSVRTVEDVVKRELKGDELHEEILGTKVGQKILSRDKDTLFPLQGIMGFDVAQTLFVGPYVLVVEGPTEAGYINWFSRQLVARDREGLDLRWAVAPAEGANKVTSFVTLFAGRGLKIAALLDYHNGQKAMVDKLEQSDLLEHDHLLKTATYANQSDADIEDLLGRPMYTYLVSEALGLAGPHTLPDVRPADAPERVVKEVEDHCRTLPPGFPGFTHYLPVHHLMGLAAGQIDKIVGIDDALDNFEGMFKDLNKLL